MSNDKVAATYSGPAPVPGRIPPTREQQAAAEQAWSKYNSGPVRKADGSLDPDYLAVENGGTGKYNPRQMTADELAEAMTHVHSINPIVLPPDPKQGWLSVPWLVRFAVCLWAIVSILGFIGAVIGLMLAAVTGAWLFSQ